MSFISGEIVLGGGNIALGYFRLPDKTAEDFFTESRGTRWFRTGDVGEIFEDGNLIEQLCGNLSTSVLLTFPASI
jgi:long-subunit acyl-CoA synthetase (AMP-forming)